MDLDALRLTRHDEDEPSPEWRDWDFGSQDGETDDFDFLSEAITEDMVT